MHRPIAGLAVVALGALALLPFGCAAPGADAGVAGTVEPAYPDWVRLVPAETAEASYYVGSISLARDVDEAVEGATADAMDQVVEGQRRHVVDLFDRAARDAGIETTSDERLQFRTGIANELSRGLEPATRTEDVYFRHCVNDRGEPREAVCEAFVLLRLDHAERDRIFDERLAAIGQRKQREGGTNTAALIEWILKNQ
jgi:hypothetical protein